MSKETESVSRISPRRKVLYTIASLINFNKYLSMNSHKSFSKKINRKKKKKEGNIPNSIFKASVSPNQDKDIKGELQTDIP